MNDADGQIGYLLRFFPQTTELSGKIVAALKAEGVSCGTRGSKGGPDWHHYSYMFPVVLKAPMAAGASPFTDPRYTKAGGKAEYHRGGCPVGRRPVRPLRVRLPRSVVLAGRLRQHRQGDQQGADGILHAGSGRGEVAVAAAF